MITSINITASHMTAKDKLFLQIGDFAVNSVAKKLFSTRNSDQKGRSLEPSKEIHVHLGTTLGSHGIQGERKGNQSSPTEYKGRLRKTDGQLTGSGGGESLGKFYQDATKTLPTPGNK